MFPTNKVVFRYDISSNEQATGHADIHNDLGEVLNNIQDKIGIDGDTNPSSIDYILNNHNHDSRYYTESETDTLLSGKLDSVIAGTNITIDNTDPLNPVISSTGGGGGGDMYKVTYDPANINEQLVGLTATQTLTNKTLDSYTNFIHADGIHYRIKATENLVNGDVVKFVGFNSGEQAIEVAKRDSLTVPAIGMVHGTINTGDFGLVVFNGLFKNVNTIAYSEGTILYPNTSGGFTDTPVISNGNYNQPIAYVVRSHATNGEIMLNVGPGHDIASLVAYENSTSGYNSENVKAVIDEIHQADVDTNQMTGFLNNTGITINYSHTNRTITLTGTIEYYWKGIKKTLPSGWTSSAHTATVGNWFLYSSDGDNFVWSMTPWDYSYVMIAFVRYETLASNSFAIREVHGVMDVKAHEEFHQQIGTYRRSGGTLTAGTYTENIATDSATTPGFDSAVVKDEDIESTIPAWTEGTYTTMHIGASNTAVFNSASSFPFISTGSYLQVNNPTTGSMTDGVTNKYYNVYQILVPTTADSDSQKFRIIMLQPQTTYDSLSQALLEDSRFLQLGNFSNLATEWVLYARITYVTSASDANTGKCRIATGGVSYVVGSRAGTGSISGYTPTNHAGLTNLGWTASGHTGTATRLAGFDGSGVASEYTLSGTGTQVALTTSPTFTTPILGIPTSGTLTNCTGLPEGGLSLTDITTNDVSTTKHGFAPKAPNDTTKFLRGDGTRAVPAGGGLTWGASITNTSGTGITTTIGNNASAGIIGISLTRDNTQSTGNFTLLDLNPGTSTYGGGKIINIATFNNDGITITRNNSATANSYGINVITGTGATAGQTNYAYRAQVNNSSGYNVGLFIQNSATSTTLSGYWRSAGISIYQVGAGGLALGIYGYENINASTNGLVNYTLDNTQSGATVMQKIDTGTSSQAHTGVLANLTNASTSAKGFSVTMSTTGTGTAFIATSSVLSGAEKAFDFQSTPAGALTSRTTDYGYVYNYRLLNSGSGTASDNFNMVYFKRVNSVNAAGATLNATGSVVKIENVPSAISGTLADTTPCLSLVQNTAITSGNGGHILFNAYTPGTEANVPNNTLRYDGTNLKYKNNAGTVKTVTVT